MSANKIGVNELGEMRYDNLLGGHFPQSTEGVTLLAGTNYPIGAVLGKATATGKCALADSTKSDGTEKVYGVLLAAVDATDGDRMGVAALTGEFNQYALAFGGTDTFETHRAAARALCIFFKDVRRQPNQ